MGSNGTFPVTLSSVSFLFGLGATEHTFLESSVINNTYFIILLVSDDVVNTLEFLEEDFDNFIDYFDVISKSVNFGHVPLPVFFKFSFGSFNSNNRGLPSCFTLSFIGGGKNEIVIKFG